ncbi:MAG: DUF4339 domain-containing protein [Pirellulales bacterium]
MTPPSARRWWIAVDRQSHGPWTVEEIRSLQAARNLSPETMVRDETGGAWCTLRDVPELKSLVTQQLGLPVADAANPRTPGPTLAELWTSFRNWAASCRWPTFAEALPYYLFAAAGFHGIQLLSTIGSFSELVAGDPLDRPLRMLAVWHLVVRVILVVACVLSGIQWKSAGQRFAFALTVVVIVVDGVWEAFAWFAMSLVIACFAMLDGNQRVSQDIGAGIRRVRLAEIISLDLNPQPFGRNRHRLLVGQTRTDERRITGNASLRQDRVGDTSNTGIINMPDSQVDRTPAFEFPESPFVGRADVAPPPPLASVGASNVPSSKTAEAPETWTDWIVKLVVIAMLAAYFKATGGDGHGNYKRKRFVFMPNFETAADDKNDSLRQPPVLGPPSKSKTNPELRNR